MKVRSIFVQITRSIAFALFMVVGAYGSVQTADGKSFELTTKSKEARDAIAQVMHRIEMFQTDPDEQLALAQKAVAADPGFAFAHYYVATYTRPAAAQKPHMDKALELAKAASEGERRYIEAVSLVRSQRLTEAIAILSDLAKQYPAFRLVFMMLGQANLNLGKTDDAKIAFETALKLDGSTARVYQFLGNIALTKDDYGKAREMFAAAISKKPKDLPVFQPHYGFVFACTYQGDVKAALKALEDFQAEYSSAADDQSTPPVFVWNAIGRLLLENGRAEDSISAYEKGYETVVKSSLPDIEKKIWQGRMHHGKGRALAKMGKHEEAWKEAELIKKMIDEGGERGEEFQPSYHYIAGYLKLESKDYEKAIEHLLQANPDDPFHKLLLARAYEGKGDQANAQRVYKQIVNSDQIASLERALSYPEAKRKLKG